MNMSAWENKMYKRKRSIRGGKREKQDCETARQAFFSTNPRRS